MKSLFLACGLTKYRPNRLVWPITRDSLRMPPVKKIIRGFTIIELMVTVAVLAVAVAIAVPTYTNMLINNRMASKTNEFVASLHYTRSEAVKRGANVRACASSDGVTCATTGDWDQGWIVFVEAASTVLNVYPPLRDGDTLVKSGLQTRAIRFDGNGMSAGFNGTVTLCDRDGDVKKARAVVISNAGRIQLAADSNSDGIVENGSGVNVTCP